MGLKHRFRPILLLLAGVVLGVFPMFAANVFMREYVLEQGAKNLEQSANRALEEI